MGGVLALDLATRTGWAFAPDGTRPAPSALERAGSTVAMPVSGVWNFKRRTDGQRFAACADTVRDAIDEHKPAVVVFEAPIFTRRDTAQTRRVLLGLIAIVDAECARRGIEPFEVQVNHVKTHALGLGNGKRDKPAMVRAARSVWGNDIIDDDHADALWLLDYTLACLGRGS
jgi:Holliday junction resolvasome RuvABC endonuclease subunit